MDKIAVASGLVMPFLPMRPAIGRPLRTAGSTKTFCDEVLEKHEWIVHPKRAGQRAVLVNIDKTVHLQDRFGNWLTTPVARVADFKKLPNRTVLDGEIIDGEFHPFDCLAIEGRSYMAYTVMEREVLAYQLTRFIKRTWKFERPSKNWMNSHKLREGCDGVILKRAGSPYIIMSSLEDSSLDWLKRCWS